MYCVCGAVFVESASEFGEESRGVGGFHISIACTKFVVMTLWLLVLVVLTSIVFINIFVCCSVF